MVDKSFLVPTFQSAAVSQPPSRVTMWFKLTVSNTSRVNVLYINTNLYPSFSIRSTLSPFPGPCLSNLFSPSQAECRGKSPKPSNSITTRVVWTLPKAQGAQAFSRVFLKMKNPFLCAGLRNPIVFMYKEPKYQIVIFFNLPKTRPIMIFIWNESLFHHFWG